jgi:hypothetical protein
MDKTYHTIDLASLVKNQLGLPPSYVPTNTTQSVLSRVVPQGPEPSSTTYSQVIDHDHYAQNTLKSSLETHSG